MNNETINRVFLRLTCTHLFRKPQRSPTDENIDAIHGQDAQ